jgi:hypothetical protein
MQRGKLIKKKTSIAHIKTLTDAKKLQIKTYLLKKYLMFAQYSVGNIFRREVFATVFMVFGNLYKDRWESDTDVPDTIEKLPFTFGDSSFSKIL